jgi:hypothetical protein
MNRNDSMTPTLLPRRGDDADTTPLTWRNVDDGLWVATVDGEFAGMTEQQGSTYLVTDEVAHPVGTYRSLDHALGALPLSPGRRPRGRRPLGRRRGR